MLVLANDVFSVLLRAKRTMAVCVVLFARKGLFFGEARVFDPHAAYAGGELLRRVVRE